MPDHTIARSTFAVATEGDHITITPAGSTFGAVYFMEQDLPTLIKSLKAPYGKFKNEGDYINACKDTGRLLVYVDSSAWNRRTYAALDIDTVRGALEELAAAIKAKLAKLPPGTYYRSGYSGAYTSDELTEKFGPGGHVWSFDPATGKLGMFYSHDALSGWHISGNAAIQWNLAENNDSLFIVYDKENDNA